ncbi:MAG: transcription antitermination factor NusB [SAR324 cluster bacterium]|nr:transcription antitermination factor NusB [SAR324 cluster bacterium]
MSYSRHKCREYALQILYQLEIITHSSVDQDINTFLDQLDVSEDGRQFVTALAIGTLEHQNEIDNLLKENMEKWRLERLSVLVRNLLRLSVYELKISKETPYEIIIDESVTLARDFVDEIARRFVNKVLQNIHDSSQQ